jgi:hypothetical protein
VYLEWGVSNGKRQRVFVGSLTIPYGGARRNEDGSWKEIVTRAAGRLWASSINPPPIYYGRKTGALEASTTVTWEVWHLWTRNVGLPDAWRASTHRDPPETHIVKAGNSGGKLRSSSSMILSGSEDSNPGRHAFDGEMRGCISY